MSSNPPPASGDSSAQAVKERLHRLEQDLIRQRKRLEATTWLTAIVGFIVLAVIGYFFYWGYGEVSIFKDPDKIVNTAQAFLDDNIPQLRRRLESEIIQSAPQWASTLSKEAIGYLPVGRKQLEKLALENVDDALAETRAITDKQFREFYANHHKDLEKKFDELAKNPNSAENLILDLGADLEKDLGVNMQADATALLKEITTYSKNFKKLREGKDLNHEQEVERRAFMLARRAYKEGLDLSTTGLPDIAANGQAIPTTGQKPVAGDGRPSKLTKRAPVPASQEDNKKDATKTDQKKDSTPEAGKKDAEKKKGDSEKKKD
jgi:hypothetical protein